MKRTRRAHTALRCAAKLRDGGRCRRTLGVLPGEWAKTKPLRAGDFAAVNRGALVCPDPGCRARWEIVQRIDDEEPAAEVAPSFELPPFPAELLVDSAA